MKNQHISVIFHTIALQLKEAADIVERSYSKMGVLRELRNILGHARDYIAANEEE